MGDDQISIDPAFDASSRRRRRGPLFVAVVVALVFFGWLLWPPSAPEDEVGGGQEAASTTASDVIETTTTRVAGEDGVASSEWYEALSIEFPVADFTDEIVMSTTPNDGYRVVRWSVSALSVLSMDRRESDGPIGLDASGSWFAHVNADRAIAVHPTLHGKEEWSVPELVGSDVEGGVWHDTEAGRLAWLACSETGAATVFTADVGDGSAAPEELWSSEQGCSEDLDLMGWDDRGIELHGPGADDQDVFFLVDEAGSGIVADPGFGTAELHEVPGFDAELLTEGEQVWDVLPSPEGSRIAVMVVAGWEPRLLVIDAATGDVVGGLSAADGLDWGTMAWSTDGRFLMIELWDGEHDLATLFVTDTIHNATTIVPIPEIVDEIRSIDARDRWAHVEGRDIAPTSDDPHPVGGDTSLDDAAQRLPVGTRTAAPDNPRLDFLATKCEVDACFRDAEIVVPGGEDLGTWVADTPFHIRHGFVNEAEAALGDAFDLVVYVIRRSGPELEHAEYEIDRTYRFASDYVLREITDRCGPGYWGQAKPQTCEWFVHDFPDGLPAGRYDIWTEWRAPCSTWLELGYVDACTDPALVSGHFWSTVNMPFDSDDWEG